MRHALCFNTNIVLGLVNEACASERPAPQFFTYPTRYRSYLKSPTSALLWVTVGRSVSREVCGHPARERSSALLS